MRKTARLTGTLLLAALALTACGDDDETAEDEAAAPAEEEGPDAAGWFAENCPAEVGEIREGQEIDGDDRELVGDALGEAMTQGAVHPPAGLEGSTHEIGLYSYDELADRWVQEDTASSDDLFCFEQGMESERVSVSDLEGDLYQDENNVNLTEMRSPEYPEGIWVAQRFTPRSGYDVEEEWAACQSQWHPATEVTPFEEAESAEEGITNASTQSADDC